MADLRLVFKRRKRRTLDDRNIVAREVVRRQQLANFHLNKLKKLFVVNLVDLVHEHDKRRNTNLAGKQNVLAGLWHRAISRRHNQNPPSIWRAP